jgi:hypothetical protein
MMRDLPLYEEEGLEAKIDSGKKIEFTGELKDVEKD